MKIFDLSQPLFDQAPNCPVHPPVSLPVVADHPADGWRMEEFHMASHTGTHLDAPLHKLAGGASIDSFPLESFVGEPVVFDFHGVPADHPLQPEDFQNSPHDLKGKIILLRTGWGDKREKSDEWLFHPPVLTPAAAQFLVDEGIKGVGIDHFSISGGKDPDNSRTHEILLGAGVWIVEELNFRSGWQEFVNGATFQALPLLLPGFSGSPCRAILFKNA